MIDLRTRPKQAIIGLKSTTGTWRPRKAAQMGCSIEGCGRSAMRPPGNAAAAQITPRICTLHAVTIWRQVQALHGYEPVLEQLDQVKRIIKADTPKAVGDIYAVRLNGLIKIGWTSDLYQRFRAYGASVEILCHYPGSRKDETELHQILRPALAKGREWYHEHPVVTDHIARMVSLHGEPTIEAVWTSPRQGGRS